MIYSDTVRLHSFHVFYAISDYLTTIIREEIIKVMLYKFKLTSINLNILFRLSMILILLETLVLLYNKVCIRKSHAFGGFDLNTTSF